MSQIGEKILKLIYDMNFDSHPLIFHVFSNGGAFLYQHVALANRRSKKPVQICGMIFDSAPGDRRVLGLFRAVSAILGKERRCNKVVSAIMTIGLIFLWAFEVMIWKMKVERALSMIVFFLQDSFNYFRSFIRPFEVQTNPSHNLKYEINEWPQLFLYSKEDRLIPYTVSQ